MVRIYSGTEINISMLRAELAKVEIPSLVKNEFKSGVLAGFGATPDAVDLYVDSSDVEEVTAILKDLDMQN